MKKAIGRICSCCLLLVALCALAGCQGESAAAVYRLTYAAAAGGTIEGETQQTVGAGENGSAVTAVPAEHYVFTGWSDGCLSATRQDTEISADLTATAQFAAVESAQLTVRYLAAEGGSISAGEQSVPYGGSALPVTAQPDPGYRFVCWSDGLRSAVRTDTDVRAAGEWTAYFEREVYTVQYAAQSGGSIRGNDLQTIYYGSDATPVLAVPDEGYLFESWSDGVTDAQRTDCNIRAAQRFVASFKPIRITLRYLCGEGGTLRGGETQTLNYGQDATEVTAVPDEGFLFVGWSDGGESATRTDCNVKASAELTAYFAKTYFAVDYLAGEGGSIDGNSGQTVYYGEDATPVTAVSARGYLFVGWSDGVETATRVDLGILAAQAVTAQFEHAFSGGGGTSASQPFFLRTPRDLRNLGLYPDAYYRLEQDIDLSGETLSPLFDEETRFEGWFDGGGHSIRNLSLDASSKLPSLFGVIGEAGLVQNLNVFDAELVLEESRSGVKSGILSGVSYGTLSRVSVSGSVRAVKSYLNCFGGLVGDAAGKITHCRADVSFSLKDGGNITDIGGLCGRASADLICCTAEGDIQINCSNSILGGLVGKYQSRVGKEMYDIVDCHAKVNLSVKQTALVGGFISRIYSDVNINIENCSADANIDSNKSVVSGFIFYLYGINPGSIVVENCSASGNWQGENVNFIMMLRNAILRNCESTGTINSRSYAVGFAYQISNSQLFRCRTDCQLYSKAVMAFARGATNSTIEECSASGICEGSGNVSGFIESLSHCTLVNCYSTSDLRVVDSGQKGFSVFGFAYRNDADSTIVGCYCAGQTELAEFADETVVSGSTIAAFACYNAGVIQNCHVLFEQDGAATSLIAADTSEQPVELKGYASKAEMTQLADALNAGLDVPVWTDVADGLPKLSYEVSPQ